MFLQNFSLSITPGSIVALVGPSGGGKSTVVSLIERFYDCDSGEIRISGIPIKNLDPFWFRAKMTLVSQEPTLFNGPISENIACGVEAGKPEVSSILKLLCKPGHKAISMIESALCKVVGKALSLH